MRPDVLVSNVEKVLRARERYLVDRPVATIARSLSDLSRQWMNKKFLFRKKAVKNLTEHSGYTPPMAEALLDSIFRELQAAKLLGLLKSELGDPRVLDGFARDSATGLNQRAQGPRLITHFFAGNVPNPSILSFVFGMLVKSANIGKVSSSDPGFLDIYLESLVAADPQLAAVNFLIKPDNRAGVAQAVKMSDLVVAYGNDQTLKEIRKIVTDAAVFIGYGHKISFAIYLHGALGRTNVLDLAHRTARDVWMLDQRGCLSPRVLYLEEGGEVSPETFAEKVADELGRLNQKASGNSFSHSALARLLCNDFFMAQVKKGGEKMWSDETMAWSVIYGGPLSEITLEESRQCLLVKPFSKLPLLFKALEPFKQHFQAAALEGPGPQKRHLAENLSVLGFNRLCRAGKMQEPPLAWRHDGQFNLASWVRWTDLE